MKKLLLLLLFLIVFLGEIIGQTFTNNLPVSDIAGTGTAIPSTHVLQQIPIGFSFSFYGSSYTDVYLAPNGALRFGTGLAGGANPYDGPMYYAQYYSNNRNMLAFALDYYVRPGVYASPVMNYFTTGIAPNRVLVINFKNISLNNASLSTNPDAIVSVQLQLYEGSNTIEVHNLKNKSFGAGFAYNRTFGISNSTGSLYPNLPSYDYSATFNLDNKMVRIQTCTPPTQVPTVSLSATTVTCGGTAVTLSASGCASGNAILWSDGQIGNSIIVKPKLTTAYSAACTTTDHCVGAYSATQNVTVTNAIPTISNAGTVICPASTKTLTANVNVTGGAYQWFRNGTLLTGSTNSTYVADSATKFKVRYTIGSCVMLSDSVVIIRSVKPAKPVVNGPIITCSGGQTVLSTSGCNGTINWVSGTTGTNTIQYVYPTVVTKYAATCTNSDGCISATSDTLTVTPLIIAPPSITTNLTTVCGGDSVTLTATGCSGTVQWSDYTYGTPIKKFVGTSASTSFTAQCIDNGCTSVSSNVVTITATQVSPNVSSSSYYGGVCQGDSLTLTASTSVTGGTWQWYRNGVAITLNGTSNIYKAFQTGMYQAGYIKGTCTAKSLPKSVTVLPVSSNVPVITSSNNNLCSSGYVYLSATGCASNEQTYWYINSSNSYSATGSSTSIYQSNTSASYTARCVIASSSPYYTSCGGTASNAIVGTINTPTNPTGLTASATTVACGGSTAVTLTATGCASAYSWSSNVGTTSTSASVSVTPLSSQSYQVYCKSATGCLSTSSSNVAVTVTSAVPNISPADTVSACPGTSGYVLTASTPTSGGTLQWANTAGDIASATGTSYTALVTDNYTVKQTVGACVLTSKPTRVLIGQVKAPKITAASNTSPCNPGNIYFNSTGCSGTITWSDGSTGSSTSIYISGLKYIWAKCSTGTGCISPKSDSIKVNATFVEISPKKDSIFCVGGSYQLNASSATSGLTYKWKLNGNYISGATNSTYSATTNGVYSLETTTTGSGCVATTTLVNLQTNVATAPIITGSPTTCSLSPQKIWDKRFGGILSEPLTTMLSLSPTEYLFGGYSSSGQDGDKSQSSRGFSDYWIVKTDSSGTKLWDRRYGGSDGDILSKILSNGNNLVLGGSSYSGISGDKTEGTRGGSDFWIVKTDLTSGTILWNRRYGGNNAETLSDIIETSDSGYLLGGYSSSPQGGDKTSNNKGNTDYWVVKIDGIGTKQWDKSYGNPNGSNSLRKTLSVSGGYLLCGFSDASVIGEDKTQAPKGNNDFWVVNIDAAGTKIWDKVIGGNNGDNLIDAVSVSGGTLLFGSSSSPISGDKTSAAKGSSDYWLVKIDNSGNILWDKTYGGIGNEQAKSIKALADGSIVMMGHSDSGISGDKTEASKGATDYWVVKTDANGNKIWDKVFGSTGSDYAGDFIVNSDGSYVLGGYTNSGVGADKTQGSQGQEDFWIVKASSCQTTALPTSIVTGQSVILNAGGCVGTIAWSGGVTASTSSVTVSPTATTTYTATCSIVGCIATQSTSVTITVVAIPTPTISSVPSPAVACTGSPAVLTAAGCPGGSSFLWTPSSGTGISISVTPASNTSYTVACVVGGNNGTASVATLVKNVSQITSITSGNYNVPATWDCNCIPLSCSVVTINPTHNVVIPVSIIGKAKNVVMKGTLDVKATGKLSLNNP